MIVKCPICEAEHDCTPGEHQCGCGASFNVGSDGTITPCDTPKAGGSSAPDKTGIRIRRETGDLQVGDVVLGRYELLEKLGSGSMGAVFKCRDRVSQAEYAVKMVPPELARDADAMEKIREHFQLIRGLKHPNIASVAFLDRDEYGAYFIIMEYAPGENLAHWIKLKWKDGGPLLSEVASIVRQIASALDCAHDHNILHRNLKPANVMVDEVGNVKILDFGLASVVRNAATAPSVKPTNAGGTPNYLSPEEFKGKCATAASDQYALGVMTYQMLADHLPFQADDYDMLRAMVSRKTPEVINDIPDATNRCLLKVLNKNPQRRFASCTEFADALMIGTDARISHRLTSRRAGLLKQLKRRRKRRNRFMWWIAIIWIMIVAAIAIISVSVPSRTKTKTNSISNTNNEIAKSSEVSGNSEDQEETHPGKERPKLRRHFLKDRSSARNNNRSGDQTESNLEDELAASRRVADEDRDIEIEDILFEHWDAILLGVLGVVFLFVIGLVVKIYFPRAGDQ